MQVNAFGQSQAEMALADLRAKYESTAPAQQFLRLYEEGELQHMFAVLHKKLNDHFVDINGRIDTTHHYWADNSRDLLALIREIREDLYTLNRAGVEVEFDARYQASLEYCETWLSPSGGSAVPDTADPIEVLVYEPVFKRASETVQLAKERHPIKLKMIGEGSYAHVYSYVDPDYGIKFAVKRAKREISGRDLERFKKEFEYLKQVRSPYVVEAYKYDEQHHEYRMEFCDSTLRTYISENNNKLRFETRRRIALQFLYGLNHLHKHRFLHRDLSLQNVLIKKYDHGAVVVKLSDFGLLKDESTAFTMSQTEMRGTIRDPLWSNFKDFDIWNEVYAAGMVLAYIFTGSESVPKNTSKVSAVIHKCTSLSVEQRYSSIIEVIRALDSLRDEQNSTAI